MRNIYFEADAYKDYVEWSYENREIFNKINDLILDITRDPFKGMNH
jgi:toxin YoeB